ncbi:MAG TPA: DsrE family protein [Woeseiaceae bacterium]|jgi:predicted peroxiredoxin|nr:DsrE family protein [Woeseiaceae bacterium]
MSDYLIIESRDPLQCADTRFSFDLASGLAAQGKKVSIFLVQNGVMPARRGARTELFDMARDAGVTVLADDFSLRERGIGADQLVTGVSASPMEIVVDALAAGTKTFWH